MTAPTEMDFTEFFQAATRSTRFPSGTTPYDYQRRLACGERLADTAEIDWLKDGTKCESKLIAIPTGLGKTASVVLAWLWNRALQGRSDWPRRLVYCLPMRTLVEQTDGCIREWIKNLKETGLCPADQLPEVHILMGGEDAAQWDLQPEKNAILIGTQDMLLSRALNRGYGMSRYRWPMHFGLLNTDCLWVMDETQLMGVGLTTTVQLDGFRQELWQPVRPCLSWWMSATSAKEVFNTTDRRELGITSPECFPKDSDALTDLGNRLNAEKQIECIPIRPKAATILKSHQAGRITLLIANTVASALGLHQEIGAELDKRQAVGNKKTKSTESEAIPELYLLHSRFRARDRDGILKHIQSFQKQQPKDGSPVPDHPGIIIVSTQVIEAGYDLSSSALWSEIAPWASVIQRLGRLNRDGLCKDAKAFFWMPKPETKSENSADSPNAQRLGPYDKKAVETAKALLSELTERLSRETSYSKALDEIQSSPAAINALETPITHAIRPDDLHGLFSTEPDLAGGFTNIASYVRDGDRNSDVTVYWREFKGTPPEDIDEPDRNEIVSVPFFDFQKFLTAQKCQAFLWDEDGEHWNRISFFEIIPGMTLLLPRSIGGYSAKTGWTGRREDQPMIWPPEKQRKPRRLFGEGESETGWESLPQHTDAVCRAVEYLFGVVGISDDLVASAILAARWHDVGKAHIRWQTPLICSAPSGVPAPWGKFTDITGFRPGFRHEALSLLCAWSFWPHGPKGLTALALYLIASHHGKVRTTLRSIGDGGDLFGLLESDEPLLLPGFADTPFAIDTSRKSFAGDGRFDWEGMAYIPEKPSWASIIDELLGPAWRDDSTTTNSVPVNEPRKLGPFCLAYIETLFRAADARASRGEFLPTRA